MNVPAGVHLADTITKLPGEAEGAVIVSSSHGGRYAGYLALKARPRAVILNDAGVGKDQAGIGALAYLESFGVAAATVSHASCRIGEAADMWVRGVISAVNALAARAGVMPGQPCRQAAESLRSCAAVAVDSPPALAEGRSVLRAADSHRSIVLLDSAALVTSDDTGQIIVTGSHGALVGGDPKMALRTEGFAAVFNDAGIGADGCGTTRLPALERRGIRGLTVAAASARIGEARSTFEDGVISAANEAAQEHGARVGLPLRPLLETWARER